MSFGIPVRNGLAVGLLASTFLSSLRIGGRPAMFLNFIGTDSLDSRVTFTRASTATFVGSNGLIQSAAINAPRFDYTPVTLQAKGLLIEEQRINLLTYSEQFDNVVWVKSQGAITANAAISPDGTQNADAFIENTVPGVTHDLSQLQTVAAATTYTATIYIKPIGSRTVMLILAGTGFAESRTWFNLTTLVPTTTSGSITSASVIPVGNGWYRCTVTRPSTAAGLGTVSYRLWNGTTAAYTGDGTSGLNYYGAQLEAGAFSTSYIPTVASQVTRSADVATMTGTNFSSWYNQTQGTFVTQFTPSTISGTRAVFDANDNTINESVRAQTVAADPFFVVTDGGVDQANIDAGTVAANTTYKMAGAYAANSFAASISGGAAVTDVSGTLPTVTQLQIGNSAAGNRLNGSISSISYYNTRLSNSQLQALTV